MSNLLTPPTGLWSREWQFSEAHSMHVVCLVPAVRLCAQS